MQGGRSAGSQQVKLTQPVRASRLSHLACCVPLTLVVKK